MFSDLKTEADYKTGHDDTQRWYQAMQIICDRHGLPASELIRQNTGSAIVYACAGRIIKLYCPIWPEEIQREKLGLTLAPDRLGLPIPQCLAEGDLEGWPYLIMTQLPGQMIRRVWKDLSFDAQLSLSQQMGELIAKLHHLPPISDPWLDQKWDDFCAQRLREFPEHQAKIGLKEPWVCEFTARLKAGIAALPEASPIFLHCDLTDDHFLVDQVNQEWKITGLIDFADAMKGHYLYEFAAPLVLLTHGQPRLRQAMLRAYGLDLRDEALPYHLLTQILVHRFVHLPWYFKTYFPDGLSSIQAFQDYFCGLNNVD